MPSKRGDRANITFRYTGNALVMVYSENVAAVREAMSNVLELGKIKSARQGQFSIVDRDSTSPHIKQVRVVSTVEYYLSD